MRLLILLLFLEFPAMGRCQFVLCKHMLGEPRMKQAPKLSVVQACMKFGGQSEHQSCLLRRQIFFLSMKFV
jgi:hypothetical protein